MTPRPILLSGGRLIDPSTNRDEVGDLLIVDGKIASVGGKIAGPDGCETIACGGLVVSPGLVDVHVHLREPGREDVEQSLCRVLVLPVAGVDDARADPLPQEFRRARRGVTDHHHVDVHRLEVARGVDEGFPLAH